MFEPKPVLLIIEPPRLLLGSMPHEERVLCVMLLGLDAESPARDSLRLLLHVIFQPIVIRRRRLTTSDYYVATTGGTVAVRGLNAKVVEHTGPDLVAVQCDVSVVQEIAGSRKLVPELKGKLGATELEVKPGSVERGEKSTVASGIKFASEEMLLAPTNLGDEVDWRIDSHRGEKAVRDFLVRNLDLEATFRWKTEIRSGTVRACPSDISFFDSSKRRLSKKASILMRYVLWKKGVRIANVNGVEVRFVEQQDERV
jgi:hypothetical protein